MWGPMITPTGQFVHLMKRPTFFWHPIGSKCSLNHLMFSTIISALVPPMKFALFLPIWTPWCTPTWNRRLKNYFVPSLNPQHPAYCVPVAKDSWKIDTESYAKYCKQLFAKAFCFNYVPYFQFPFHQGSNFLTDGSAPRMVPMQNLGKLSIRFTFFDKQSHISGPRLAIPKNIYLPLMNLNWC